MQIPVPAPARRFAAAVGAPVYLVGGAVRNALLGLPGADLDVAGALPPEAVADRCRAAGFAVEPRSRALGTTAVRVDGETLEYTAFRAERYAPGGAHRPESVQFGATLEEDAARRDFTCNALYADCRSGAVTDPLGGLPDVAAHTLRQAGPRTLESDALRVLRLVRLACELGFDIEPATFDAARAHAGALPDIAQERRREELDRILVCDARYPAAGRDEARSVLRALRLLDALGAWPCLVPEVEAGRSQAQRPDHHRYPVMEHLFHACAAAPATPVLRLAALLHDIGKPACLAATGRLWAHDRYGEAIVQERLPALRYPRAVVSQVAALVRHHMYDIQGTAHTATLRTRFVCWGRPFTEQLIALREADIRGCGYRTDYVHSRWRALLAEMAADGTPFSEAELAIDGAGIMRALGIGPGPRVGQVKRALLLHCARRPEDNTPARLAALAHDISSFSF